MGCGFTSTFTQILRLLLICPLPRLPKYAESATLLRSMWTSSFTETLTPHKTLYAGEGGGANKTATGEQERATRYSTSRISQFSEKALDIALPEYLSHVLHKGMAIHSCVGGSRAMPGKMTAESLRVRIHVCHTYTFQHHLLRLCHAGVAFVPALRRVRHPPRHLCKRGYCTKHTVSHFHVWCRFDRGQRRHFHVDRSEMHILQSQHFYVDASLAVCRVLYTSMFA